MIISHLKKKQEHPSIIDNTATQKHFELKIKMLQNAPRDPDQLRAILKVKQKEYEKAEDSEDIDRLVPEIEMLKFVLFLVSRIRNRKSNSSS